MSQMAKCNYLQIGFQYSTLNSLSFGSSGIVVTSIPWIQIQRLASISRITRSIAASRPWISIVTDPSHSFLHHPVQSYRRAACRARQRKPTPWTCPVKTICFRIMCLFLSQSGINMILSYSQHLTMKQEIHNVQMGNAIPAHINPVQGQNILRGGVLYRVESAKFTVNCALTGQEI